MRQFTIPAETYDERNLNKRDILHLIQKHRACIPRLETLEKYYGGQHKILSENRANKLVCNHAKDISDTASSYFIGNPVAYKSDQDITPLTDELESAGADEADGDLGLDLSVYGRAYEYIYAAREAAELRIKNLPPQNTFIVCDDTIEKNELFGVYYYPKIDDTDKTNIRYAATVVTQNYKYVLNIQDTEEIQPLVETPEPHFMGEVPIIEYQNNKKLKGDFEGVISLIDAYNLLQSDRLNDKEQMVDALLAVAGASLGDDQDEQVETARLLKEMKIIELDEGGDAKWLVKGLNEEQTEVLKKSLKDDIHEFSKVPCLTDENFVGNTSGVAMKYKLLGFEQLGKTKERYFKKGLRQRLKLMANIENIRAKNIDTKAIDIIMKRSLPVDDELLAKIAQETEGFISWETRVQRFDSEIDIEEERKRLEEERQKSIEETQKAFGSYEFKEENEDDSDSLDSNGD